MPSGKIEKCVVVDSDEDYKTESSVSSEEIDDEEHEDLLEGKEPKTILDIANILIDKGGISVGNLLGVQHAFKILEESDANDHMKGEMFSTINMLIMFSNLYLDHLKKEKYVLSNIDETTESNEVSE